MGCWKMVYLDISSSWFDNSGTIDMGKDETKTNVHLSCIWHPQKGKLYIKL